MQSDDFWQGIREESMAIGCNKGIFVQDQDGSPRESEGFRIPNLFPAAQLEMEWVKSCVY